MLLEQKALIPLPVLEFLQKHLKPAAIEESNSYLTPLLQDYKAQLGQSPRMR